MPARRWLVFVTACAALSGCVTPPADDPAIRDFVARFVRSVNEANVDEFVACFDPNATAFFPSSANAMRRVGRDAIRSAVEPTFQQGPPATQVLPRYLTISTGGGLAYVTFDGGTGAMHARRTLVLRKTRDDWTIVHLHASNVSE